MTPTTGQLQDFDRHAPQSHCLLGVNKNYCLLGPTMKVNNRDPVGDLFQTWNTIIN